MIKRTVVGLVVVALAGLVSLGAISALAGGGPVGQVAKIVTGDDGNRASPKQARADDPKDAAQAQAKADQGEPGQGAKAIAQAIAHEFGVSQTDVLALREQGIGFGAIFKLYAIAKAKGMSVSDLLASIPKNADGNFEFAFGKMMKTLTVGEQAALEAGPKNLGQLVSASHKSEGGTEEGEASEAGVTAASQDHGPPAFAKAHGRR